MSSQIDSRSALLGAGVEDEAGVRVMRLRGELDAFSAPSVRDDQHREVVARPAVVARDLSMDIKKKGESSLFIRTSPGRYTLRVLATGTQPVDRAPQPMSALAQRKPAAAAPSPVRAPTARPDTADGGGYVS